MQKKVKVKVSGKVQGVGFRFESHLQMVDLGLLGTAENTADGGVEMVVSGEEDSLKRFLSWAKQGPTGAKVLDMQYEVMPSETINENNNN